MLEDVKRAMLDYMRQYMVDPKTITMSKNTVERLVKLCFTGVIVDHAEVGMIYGMEIKENDQLPDNTFVIGGIVITSSL